MSKTTSKVFNSIWRQDINFAGNAIKGDRGGQEDYSAFCPLSNSSELLLVLADGMGGHASGEVASQNAVNVFSNTFIKYPSDSAPIRLGAALQEANSELSRLTRKDTALEGMGCTLIGAHISSDGLQWISVGDSLLYLFRDSKLQRLNADHSMTPVIEESFKQGKITREEALNHPNRHALRSAVMGQELSLIDAPKKPTPIFSRDIVIAASDGLLTLSEAEIVSILRRGGNKSAELLAKELTNAVDFKKRSRQDNTSVQVVIVPELFGGPDKFSPLARLLGITILVVIFGAAYAIYSFRSALFGTKTELTPPKIQMPQSSEITPIQIPIPVTATPALLRTPEPEVQQAPAPKITAKKVLADKAPSSAAAAAPSSAAAAPSSADKSATLPISPPPLPSGEISK